MSDSPSMTVFNRALAALDTYDLEEAAKLVVQRLDDAALIRHRGWCFDEEPLRRERERERERSARDVVVSTMTALREQGAIPTPTPADAPDEWGEDVFVAEESTIFLPGERVLHEGRLLQKTASTSKLPNDFTDTAVWVDSTPEEATE